MLINLIYNASVDNAPAEFRTAMAAAAQILNDLFTNNITLNMRIGWGENNGMPINPNDNAVANGGPSAGVIVNYLEQRSALTASATSIFDQVAIANLPSSDPTNGGQFFLASAQQKAFGQLPANDTAIDGSIGFSTTQPWNFDLNNRGAPDRIDFIGTALHELTHAMGRIGNAPSIPDGFGAVDLFAYSAPQALQPIGGQPRYFSIDAGASHLNDFDASPPPAMSQSDWAARHIGDSFGGSNTGLVDVLTQTDIMEMDAIGFAVNVNNSTTLNNVQNEVLAITRSPSTNASTVALQLNQGTLTEARFVDTLLSQVTNTTIPAVAVEGSMYEAVGTSNVITSLVTMFLPSQVTNAIANGFNPLVYASEALGLVFAFANETNSTRFADTYGPSNAGTPNSAAGDAAFASLASQAIFGAASTSILVNAIQGYVANWKGFYTGNGVPGIVDPSADQVDLAARAAAWGDAVGLALDNNLGQLRAQTVNFLRDAAQGTAVYSASLSTSTQLVASPFQDFVPPVTNVSQVGVAAQIDHLFA
jgi:hypothetical protein